MVLLPGFQSDFPLNKSIIPNGHFAWSEALHGGSRVPDKKVIVERILLHARNLEVARDKLGGFPLGVISWYRPFLVNKQVGGASDSRHMYGDGTDLTHARYSGRQMYDLLDSIWQGGMGIYPRFPNSLHLDSRGSRARWGR